MNGPILDSRNRPRVIAIMPDQRTVYGRLVGRRKHTAFVRIADERGIVRTVHARYVFTDWTPNR